MTKVSIIMKKRRLSTKEKILHSTLRLLSIDQLESIKYDDIAKEAKISRTLIYHYFPDKDCLYKTLLGEIFTFIKPLHSKKASPPISVTELGMVTSVKPLQPLKALYPIVLTELGKVTLVKPVQPWKADQRISVIVLGMTKSLISTSFRYRCSASVNGFANSP